MVVPSPETNTREFGGFLPKQVSWPGGEWGGQWSGVVGEGGSYIMGVVLNILSLHFFEISKWVCQGWSYIYGFGVILC